MKKMTLACLVASSLTTVSAYAHDWKGNWLIGGSVGYGEVDATVDTAINFIGTDNFSDLFAVYHGTDLTNNTAIYGLFAGYQAMCHRWLLGAELAVDWYDDSEAVDFRFRNDALVAANALGWAGRAEFERDTTVGLTLRAGYKVATYFIPYLRAGVEGGRDRLDVSYDSPQGIAILDPVTYRGNISVSQTSYRFVGGFGVEAPLCGLFGTGTLADGASVRAEYNYHGRGRRLEGDFLALDSIAPGGEEDVLYSVTYRPHSNTGKVSLVWNFS